MNNSRKYFRKEFVGATIGSLLAVYALSKPGLDHVVGKDSIWSRYLHRPIANMLYDESLGPQEGWNADTRTEDAFQETLRKNRQRYESRKESESLTGGGMADIAFWEAVKFLP